MWGKPDLVDRNAGRRPRRRRQKGTNRRTAAAAEISGNITMSASIGEPGDAAAWDDRCAVFSG